MTFLSGREPPLAGRQRREEGGMGGAALEARGLSKQYRRGRLALRDIDLELDPGGIVGLVEPNGAGKSTLLKTWVGFEQATEGVGQVLGADPVRPRSEGAFRGGFLPQTPSL